MEIRLAHYQGLLSQHDLNKTQYFAANYWLRMDRRTRQDDAEENRQRQTYYLEPSRYNELFLAGEIIGTEQRPDFDSDVAQDDIREIDRYFESLDGTKTMSGEQLFGLLGEEDMDWV